MTQLTAPEEPALADGGACGALLRGHDWQASPLGPPATWPSALRALVAVMLGSMQPSFIVWGAQRILLYNDGFSVMCGRFHPAALLNPVDRLWMDPSVIHAILDETAKSRGSRLEELAFTSHKGNAPASYTFSFTPIRGAGRHVEGYYCACVETTGQMLSRRATADEMSRLKQMFRYAPSAMALLEGKGHVFSYANDAFYRLFGMTNDIIGQRLDVAMAGLSAPAIPVLNKVIETGVPHVGKNWSMPIERNGTATQHWVDFVYQPMWDEEGRISGIFVQLQDVSDRAVAEKQQEVLNHEIAHRMKNQLAVVNGIVTQSLRNATDLASARAVISGRIGALAKAQTSLVGGVDATGDVQMVIANFLEVHGDERIHVEGAALPMAAKPALSLALILHELATNATKYGALSVPDGRVNIRWGSVAGQFRLVWREENGPPVTIGQRPSAGMRLISAGLAGVAASKVNLDFQPGGLVCTIEADVVSGTQPHAS